MEIISELNNAIKERIKSPVLGTFILIWIVVNWRFVLYLFISSERIERRFEHIDSQYVNWGYNLGLPLILLASYLFAFPYLLLGIEKITKHSKLERYKVAKDIEVKETEGKKDLVNAKFELEQQATGLKEYKDLRSEIDTLKGEVNNKEVELIEYKASHDNLMNLTKKFREGFHDDLTVLISAVDDKNKFTKEFESFSEEHKNLLRILFDFFRISNSEALTSKQLNIFMEHGLIEDIDTIPKLNEIRSNKIKLTKKGMLFLLLDLENRREE